MDLEFNINNQIITRVDKNYPVNKSRNYLKAQFNFKTSDWEDNVEKFAIFTTRKGDAYRVSLGRLNQCSCIIPSDVLLNRNFRVGVYSGDLITTNSVKVDLLPSNYTDEVNTPSQYNVDVFVQIFNGLNNKFDCVSFDGGALSFYSLDSAGEYVLLKSVDLELSDISHSGSYNDLIDVPEEIANVEETISENVKLSFNQLTGQIRLNGQ